MILILLHLVIASQVLNMKRCFTNSLNYWLLSLRTQLKNLYFLNMKVTLNMKRCLLRFLTFNHFVHFSKNVLFPSSLYLHQSDVLKFTPACLALDNNIIHESFAKVTKNRSGSKGRKCIEVFKKVGLHLKFNRLKQNQLLEETLKSFVPQTVKQFFLV